MSYCSCDYDQPSAFSEGTHKARKVHACSECRGIILPGEVYTKTWGVWDGDVLTFRRCEDCTTMKEWAEAHVECLCWSYGNMLRDILDELSEWDHECPGLYEEARYNVSLLKGKRRSIFNGVRQ